VILTIEKPPNLSLLEKEFCKTWLQQEKPIIFPTDTVMGIGVNGHSYQAVCNLFQIKQREETKPLILLVSSIKEAEKYVTDPKLLQHSLLQKNWPGVLTGVFPAIGNGLYLSPKLRQDTIGIRIPADEMLLDFLQDLPFPFVTTSANISSQLPMENTHQAQIEFGDKALILDEPKKRNQNQASAVVSFFPDGDYKVLREGQIEF
jgi:L-threonylcarbamoyladenylate synthase